MQRDSLEPEPPETATAKLQKGQKEQKHDTMLDKLTSGTYDVSAELK